MKKLHVLWINETADAMGGCERYIRETAAQLHDNNEVRSTLLYRDARQALAPGVREAFCGGVFPLVALQEQLLALKPDLIYVHRLLDEALVGEIGRAGQALGIPTLRFFHDHKLFCPREHKYTVVGHNTCTKPIGAHCFTCGGVVNRREKNFRLTLPTTLAAQQKVSQQLYTGFVVGSRYMAEHLEAHGFLAESVHVLPLYATEPRTEPLPFRERAVNHLVFAGQLGATGKGVDTLLQALAQVKTPATLAIYGSGKFEERYKELALKLGIEKRVLWMGKADNQTLDEAFRRATAVVVPSRSPETFGLIGPEAMRHATPVIATNVGGIGEWLDDNVTGLGVPSNDPVALAAALERLLGDRGLQERLGGAARQRYTERFTPERHTEALYALLESLV